MIYFPRNKNKLSIVKQLKVLFRTRRDWGGNNRVREGWERGNNRVQEGVGGGGAEREGKTLREENNMPKVVKPRKIANYSQNRAMLCSKRLESIRRGRNRK